MLLGVGSRCQQRGAEVWIFLSQGDRGDETMCLDVELEALRFVVFPTLLIP